MPSLVGVVGVKLFFSPGFMPAGCSLFFEVGPCLPQDGFRGAKRLVPNSGGSDSRMGFPDAEPI